MDESKTETRSAADFPTGARAGGAWWRLPLLLAVVLAAIVVARVSRVEERTPAPRKLPAPPAAATGKTVSLTIDYGGRERKFDAIAWHEGMTVDDLLNAASQMPDPISYGVLGNGELTLLTSIDNMHNEWGQGSNWTYKVNDVAADRSLAIYELEPGDRVLWTFGRQQ